MRQFLMIFTAVSLLAGPAFAAQKINITVNGMVCDFCAQAVWKVMSEYDAVADTLVDLDRSMVIVTLKDGQDLSDEELNKAITYSGYDFVSLERVEESRTQE